MLYASMNSPASLAEGMKRCPVDIEGKGAGGGLGILAAV